MIANLMNLVTTNDGKTKTAAVYAIEDSAGGTEKFEFQICDQTIPKTETFAPNQGKPVSVVHTASGRCRVVVTVDGSSQNIDEFRNLDAAQDDGTGAQVLTGTP
jgi:hypothetical protein